MKELLIEFFWYLTIAGSWFMLTVAHHRIDKLESLLDAKQHPDRKEK